MNKFRTIVLHITAASMMLFSAAAFPQARFTHRRRRELAPITLGSGQPLAAEPYALESGKYYELTIVSDGTAELALEGPSFFRNVWINEIVINDIEIRPLGVESLEFDDEGEATISFVTIRPGILNSRFREPAVKTQRAVFNVN